METKEKDNGIKLIDISTQYSKFNVNQVLTERQLNSFLDYFDDQNRFSRTSLSGVGIVCGFQVAYDEANHRIRISQGRGVTTDGDLISLLKPSETKGITDTTIQSFDLENRVYTYVQQFSDHKAKYYRFIDSDKKQIKLYELQEKSSDSNTTLDKFEQDLNNMIVLLYIESYSKNDDLCNQLTCDNQGIEQISKLRVLLVNDADAKYIASSDSIYNQHNWFETYESLPELSAKRVVLKYGNSKTFKSLKRLYFNAIKNYDAEAKKDFVETLAEGLNNVLKKFQKPTISLTAFDRLFKFELKNTPIDFQYRYDALKDIVDTYCEIKELLLNLDVRCSPKVEDFPKHLMLGRLVETKPYNTLRHAFYRSPAAGYRNDQYERITSLLERVRGILNSYNLGKKESVLKITPSLAHSKLSNKTVPYYYRVTNALLARWNFEKNKEFKHRFNLSYHTDQLSDVPSIQQPLAYNLDAFDFYRIEGHQGKFYRQALEEINKLKTDYGLSFDVKALSVETDIRDIELKDYKCKFEDLNILLDAWKAEQDCVLGEVSRFLSSFSIEDAGRNYQSEKEGWKVEKEKPEAKKEKESKELDEKLDKQSNKLGEFKKRLEEKRKEILTDEEAKRIDEYKKRIEKLHKEEKKKEAEEIQKEFGEYIKKLDGAKLSAEGIKVKEEYQKAIEDYEALMKEKMKGLVAYDMLYASHGKSSAYSVAPKSEKMSVKEADATKIAPDKHHEMSKEAYEKAWKEFGDHVKYAEAYEENKKKRRIIWGDSNKDKTESLLARKKKKEKNIVQDTLAKEEKTLGEILNNILKEYPKASKQEILALLEKELSKMVGDQWNGKENLKAFIIRDSAKLLVNIYALGEEIPKEIEDIDKGSLAQYKLTMNELCEQVKQLQAQFDKVDLNAGTKQIIGLLINQLSTVCCSSKKLEILYQEIQKRKNEIISKTTLSEFVKHHPGLEHKAGVEPGGTFVLVYLKEAEEAQAEFEEVLKEIKFKQQPEISENGRGERAVLQLWSEKYQFLIEFTKEKLEQEESLKYGRVYIGETLEETVSNLADYFNEMFTIYEIDQQVKCAAKENVLYIGIRDQMIQKESSFVQFENKETIGTNEPVYFEPNEINPVTVTEKNTVIADFSLPYLCCSECTPVNFIVPKEPVELSLPKNHICLKEGEEIERMAFKVKPANGEVAPMVPDGIESGLTFNEYGKAYFDPSLTDPSLYGKPIGFTVNHELTDCEITVYEDIPLSVKTKVEYEDLNQKAHVSFEVSHLYKELKHTWKDGIGNTSNELPNEDRIFKVEYDLPVNDENCIEPSLHVTNGICEKTIEIDPIDFEDPVNVKLDIQKSLCIDPSKTDLIKVPFTEKDPKEEEIAIVKAPIEGLKISDDHLLIDPKTFKAFGQKIDFTLAGNTTNASITIGKKTQVKLSKKDEGFDTKDGVLYAMYLLTAEAIDQSDINELKLLWKLDGNQIGTKSSVKVEIPIKEEGKEFTITLEVSDDLGCSTTESMTITVNSPEFSVSMPEGRLEYCLNDEKPYPIQIEPKVEGVKVSGAGVSYNSNGIAVFTPSKSGLVSAGSVDLFVGNEKVLTLNLEVESKAKFEWRIEGEDLIVENTSEISDQFIFVIDGQKFVRSNRRSIKRNVNEFNNAVIDIYLTAMSACGEDTYAEKGIRIREDHIDSDPYCVPMTYGRIQESKERLPKDVDLNGEIRKAVVDPTHKKYDQVLASPDSILNNGDLNIVSGFEGVWKNTSTYMMEFSEGSYERGVLSQFYIAQIKLYFNLIHCQPHEVLAAEEPRIMKTMNALRDQLNILSNKNVKFDANNELKMFFKEYNMNGEVIKYINTAINNNLLPLIL